MVKKLKILTSAITMVAGMVLFCNAAIDGIEPITVLVLLVVGYVLMYVGARTAVHFYNEEEQKEELNHEEFKKWLKYKRQSLLLEIEFRTNSNKMLVEAELKFEGKPSKWEEMYREVEELEKKVEAVEEMLEGM